MKRKALTTLSTCICRITGAIELRSLKRCIEFRPNGACCVEGAEELSGKNLVNSSSKSPCDLKRVAT